MKTESLQYQCSNGRLTQVCQVDIQILQESNDYPKWITPNSKNCHDCIPLDEVRAFSFYFVLC
jgi:hypothetical protein